MEFAEDISIGSMVTFKSGPKGSGTPQSNVNKEERTINGVIMAGVGEAAGHGYSIEASFLADALQYVKKKMGGRVQCNFGHRYNAMGFQLGAITNVRLSSDGQYMLGDLKFYEAADRSPFGEGMATWAMDMAAEDSQAVMLSYTCGLKAFYQYDNKKVKVFVATTWWGDPIAQFEDRPVYAEFEALYSCDLIDEGALTSSLFSKEVDRQMQHFAQMANSPEFIKMLREHEDDFPALNEHFSKKYAFTFNKFFKSLFSNQKEDMDPKTPPTTPAAEEAPKTESVDNLSTTIDAAVQAAMKPLKDELAEMKTQLSEKDKEINDLKKKPIVKGAEIKTEDKPLEEGADPTAAFMNSPMNRRVSRLLNNQ